MMALDSQQYIYLYISNICRYTYMKQSQNNQRRKRRHRRSSLLLLSYKESSSIISRVVDLYIMPDVRQSPPENFTPFNVLIDITWLLLYTPIVCQSSTILWQLIFYLLFRKKRYLDAKYFYSLQENFYWFHEIFCVRN